jgi:phosphatidate cytidylyltransferase
LTKGGEDMNQRFYILLWIPVLILMDYFEAHLLVVFVITCAGVYEIVLRHCLNAKMTIWMLIAFVHMAGFMLILTMSAEVFWFIVAVIVFNDVCAYFGGKYFSTAQSLKAHPFPTISPKKTVGGYIYGLIGGVIAGLLIAQLLLLPAFFSWSSFWFACGICLVGNVGDLVASKFKRVFGLKDSGEEMITRKLLAGHGGVYDRFDAISAACWAWFVLLYCVNNFI